MSVLLETSLGDIVIDLHYKLAPNACLNFLKLCKIKYYNDCEFFRIEKEFVARTGDPSNKGDGGESIFSKYGSPKRKFFKPEVPLSLKHSKKGTVSMTAASDDSMPSSSGHGSQFFFTLSDDLGYLDGIHTIFGEVTEGMSVLDKIANTIVDESFKPLRVIRIRHTIILDDPFDDLSGLPQNCPSPEPIQHASDNRLDSDDEQNPEEEHDMERLERLEQERADREARSRAEVLEMIGDIADADLTPPENVLFICKLNPVTEAEDLEIIFSRFGECNVEVIKDKDTGKSRGYGFIEFEAKSQCEKAYYKMDSVLIDDRRVHVDFSQSVSKLWNKTRQAERVQNQIESQKWNKGNDSSISKKRGFSSSIAVPHIPSSTQSKSNDSVKNHLHETTSLMLGNSSKRRRSRFDQKPNEMSHEFQSVN